MAKLEKPAQTAEINLHNISTMSVMDYTMKLSTFGEIISLKIHASNMQL